MNSLGYNIVPKEVVVADTGKIVVGTAECIHMDDIPNSQGIADFTENDTHIVYTGTCSGDPGGERGQPVEDRMNRVDDPHLECAGENFTTCMSVVGRNDDAK